MKHPALIITTILFFTANIFAQAFTETGYEKEVLEYIPLKREGLSKERFDYAMMILSETRSDVKKNSNSLHVANYFNLLSAFLELREPEEILKLAFQKFLRSEGSCEYVLLFQNRVSKDPKYSPIKVEFGEAVELCRKIVPPNSSFNIEEYAKTYNLNSELVRQIVEINDNDQRYRGEENVDWSRQTPLDLKNQELIEKLFLKYRKYIGAKMVGKKFENVMWLVIQHSNIEMMEKYLPVIHTAVKEKDLDQTTLKMLIDRIYSQKNNYQIFGSQGANTPLADEKIRSNIKKQYGLN